MHSIKAETILQDKQSAQEEHDSYARHAAEGQAEAEATISDLTAYCEAGNQELERLHRCLDQSQVEIGRLNTIAQNQHDQITASARQVTALRAELNRVNLANEQMSTGRQHLEEVREAGVVGTHQLITTS
jgi:phage host-nuclease inhibitor protein Gam